MVHGNLRTASLLMLLAATADSAEAQYRREIEELPPAFGASVSVGTLWSYSESITPVETPPPDENRRAIRDIDTQPALSLMARYGRGIAIYGAATVGFGSTVEVSGNDPETGAILDDSGDAGTILITSIGVSFVPLERVSGLRLAFGPAWLNLGSGGSYLGVRASADARFLELREGLAIVLGWDGYLAGGQDDQDRLEYQLRGGTVSGVRLGVGLEL